MSVSYRILQDKEDAQEAAQSAFVQLAVKPKRGLFDDQFHKAISTTYLNNKRWHFTAITYDRETLNLYVGAY